jgi:hypothetical protein
MANRSVKTRSRRRSPRRTSKKSCQRSSRRSSARRCVTGSHKVNGKCRNISKSPIVPWPYNANCPTGSRRISGLCRDMKTSLPSEFMATTGLYYMENGMQVTIQPGTHLYQIPSAVNAITQPVAASPMYNLPGPPQASPSYLSSPMYNLPSPPQASPSYFPSQCIARQPVRAV